MKRSIAFISVALLCITLRGISSHADVAVRLELNKQSYRVGEPVVLLTTIQNTGERSTADLVSGLPETFSIRMAKDDEEFADIYRIFSYRVMKAPVQDMFFQDRYSLGGALPPGKRFRRIDLLTVGPGRYRVKAAVSPGYPDKADSGPPGPFESKEAAFEVKPAPESSCVYQIIPREAMQGLGETMVDIFYTQHSDGIYTTPDWFGQKEFSEVAKEILEKCPDTWLREPLVYSYVLSQGRDRLTSEWPIEDPQVMTMAENFLAEYPHSWLRPEVIRVLIVTQLHKGNRKAVENLYDEATREGPENTAIRRMSVLERLQKLGVPKR